MTDLNSAPRPSRSISGNRPGRLLGAAAVIGAMAACLGTSAVASVASLPGIYTETYSGVSSVSLYNIVTANAYSDGSYGDTYDAGYSVSAGAYSFSDPFLKPVTLVNGNTFFFGESNDNIAGVQDGDTPPHLVVAVAEPYATTNAVGFDFATAFPNAPSESDILAALDTVYASGSSQDDMNAASSTLFDFIIAANTDGAMAGASGGAYSLVSFSNGAAAGAGVNTLTLSAAVPEPASWALMLIGVGVTGAGLRRRGRARTANA